jgi:branched-chain amino acid transport system substrate-binding protein
LLSVSVILILALVITLALAGCSSSQPVAPAPAAPGPAATQAPPTPAAPQAKTIKIGVTYGLTGPDSPMQILQKNTAVLAADWVNEKGGLTIKGEKYLIECAIADNKGIPPGCIDAATKLVEQDKVKFVTGCNIPVQVDAVASVTEKFKVLFAAPKSDILHADRPLSFVTNYSLAAPTPFLYDILLSKYQGIKTMGFLISDEAGARVIAGMSQNIAKARGLTVQEPVIHPWESADFYPIWTKAMAANPDAVDQGMNQPNSTAASVKQARELGYKGPIIAAIPGDPTTLLKMIGKDAATDFMYASFDPYGPESPPMIKDVVKRYEAKYGARFEQSGTVAWDAMYVLTQVIEKAQSTDPVEVAKFWDTLDTVDTAEGPAKMGGQKAWGIKHMAFNPCPISIFINGQIQFQKWFDPFIP